MLKQMTDIFVKEDYFAVAFVEEAVIKLKSRIVVKIESSVTKEK